jgi:hypothetical protein
MVTLLGSVCLPPGDAATGRRSVASLGCTLASASSSFTRLYTSPCKFLCRYINSTAYLLIYILPLVASDLTRTRLIQGSYRLKKKIPGVFKEVTCHFSRSFPGGSKFKHFSRNVRTLLIRLGTGILQLQGNVCR